MTPKFHTTPKFKSIMRKIQAAAEASGVKYALIGGNAVDTHVNPPATKDIDITLSGNLSQIKDFADRLRLTHGLKLADRILYGPNQRGYVFLDDGYKIEIIYLPKSFAFDVAKRAEWFWMNIDEGFYIAKIDDLFLLKLLAWESRGKETDKDVIAAFQLLEVMDKKTKSALMETIEDIGMGELFTRAFRRYIKLQGGQYRHMPQMWKTVR